MFKAIILLKKKEEVSSEEFKNWWIGEHAKLAIQLPGLKKLCFNPAKDENSLYDGVAELWFDSEESFSEAYKTELEYGRTIEAYRDTINIDGVDTSADFLRIGRIALTYLTTDGSKGGYYDLNEKTFLKSSGSIKRATEDGLKIAAKQAPPALIQIPIYKD